MAALAVLLGHAELYSWHLGRFLGVELTRVPLALKGGFGVDLFFAISGFVMVHAARHLYGAPGARRAFAARRLARIVPLYWLATLVAVIWAMRYGPRPDLPAMIQSFAFVPFASSGAAGRIVPVLEVGWTLNYEMLFYLIFAAALAPSARGTVQRVVLVLSGLVLLGLVADLPQPLAAWTRPIVLEFAAGMAIALIHGRGLVLPVFARLGLVGAALVLVMAGHADLPSDIAGWHRVLTWGVAGAALLAAATLGPLATGADRWWRFGGDMSYALYLCHMPLLNAAQMAWRHFHLPYGPGLAVLFTAATVLGSLAGAAVLHLVLERPLTRWLQVRLGRGSSRAGYEFTT